MTVGSGPWLRPELTAMRRSALSGPARQAVEDGVLHGTVLDYGCGHGGDVARLATAGVPAQGWDPHHRPEPPPGPADTVLCSYVLNVVADPAERDRVVGRAWALTLGRLVVAVRTTADRRSLTGASHRDGTVTARGTFHHLYAPGELRAALVRVTGRQPVSVRPGLAYTFRDDEERLALVARRQQRTFADDPDGRVLTRLVAFLQAKGRRPEPGEQPGLCAAVTHAYGSVAAAAAAAATVCDPSALRQALAVAHGRLLVVLALTAFHGNRALAGLPPEVAADARSFPGGYRAALSTADRLLFAAGRPGAVATVARRSPVGKTSPTALYVHVDAEDHLPPLLRVYAACGEVVAGRPEATTLLKLHVDRPAVSFLRYPTFDRDPHPRLDASLTVDLRALEARHIDWPDSTNRPLLHRKEEFLHPDDARASRYRRLTGSEVRAGLYADPGRIGREQGWQQVLDEAGKSLRGHRLVSARNAQDRPHGG